MVESEEWPFSIDWKPILRSICASFRSRETPLPGQQSTPEHIEVGERKGREQSRGVLCQSPVTYFAEAPQTLHNVEGMLAAGTRLRACPVDELLVLSQRPVLRAAAIDPGTDPRGVRLLSVCLAPVRLIAKPFPFFSVQQLRQLRDIGRPGVRRRQTVDNAAPLGPDVRLHPKVPLLALAALVHLG